MAKADLLDDEHVLSHFEQHAQISSGVLITQS